MAGDADIGAELLSALVGRELSSVEFVRSYVQLRFDGPCLNAFALPAVISARGALAPSDSGYRDALVGLIGRKVTDARFHRDVELALAFDGSAGLRIALDPESRGNLVESVYFNNEENHFFVA